jgi:hypothetical protein
MNRQTKIFIATLGTPIIVGAAIVGAPAKWSHDNPVVATGVVYRTETRTYSPSEVALGGLSSAIVTTRFGYPVALRLNARGGCLFTESVVPVKGSEFASLVNTASKSVPGTTVPGAAVAKLERCKGS